MKVTVVFDFPEVTHPDSNLADVTINILQDELDNFSKNNGYDWYIEEVTEG